MESKFTKGPWKFNGESQSGKDSFNVIGTILGGNYKIARCPFIITGYDNIDKQNKDEAKANALLIAAAPDLLEALIECQQQLAVLVQHNENEKVKMGVNLSIELASKAIAKALNP